MYLISENRESPTTHRTDGFNPFHWIAWPGLIITLKSRNLSFSNQSSTPCECSMLHLAIFGYENVCRCDQLSHPRKAVESGKLICRNLRTQAKLRIRITRVKLAWTKKKSSNFWNTIAMQWETMQWKEIEKLRAENIYCCSGFTRCRNSEVRLWWLTTLTKSSHYFIWIQTKK